MRWRGECALVLAANRTAASHGLVVSTKKRRVPDLYAGGLAASDELLRGSCCQRACPLRVRDLVGNDGSAHATTFVDVLHRTMA